MSRAELLAQIKEAETTAAETLEAARQERESELAQARQKAQQMMASEAKAVRDEADERQAQARQSIDTAREGILKEGQAELDQLGQDCEGRVEAAADRFVQLFMEARDA